MIENGTTVTHAPQARNEKSLGDGIVKSKRKVPRSKPIAWEYLVEFANQKREWINRYDIRKRR